MAQPSVTRLTITAAAVLVVGGVVWFGFTKDAPLSDTGNGNRQPTASTSSTSTDPELAQLSLKSETDKVEVFRRAFWRHPSAEDQIRQAERREWSDASGVQRWDWFIGVDASAALTTYLLDQNPFQLKAVQAAQTFSAVPTWFPATSAGFDLFQSPNREMTLLFNSDTQQLYATSKGHGFKPGAPEVLPSPLPQQNKSNGRLPDASPPLPARP